MTLSPIETNAKFTLLNSRLTFRRSGVSPPGLSVCSFFLFSPATVVSSRPCPDFLLEPSPWLLGALVVVLDADEAVVVALVEGGLAVDATTGVVIPGQDKE